MDIRMIGALGGIIAIVGVFLPWVTASVLGVGISVSGWDAYSTLGSYEPLIVLIVAIVTLLVAVLTKGMIQKWGTTIFGLITLILGAYYAMNVASVAGDAAQFVGVTVSVGYGLYLVIVGGIVALIGGIMAFMEK